MLPGHLIYQYKSSAINSIILFLIYMYMILETLLTTIYNLSAKTHLTDTSMTV